MKKLIKSTRKLVNVTHHFLSSSFTKFTLYW